MTASDPSFAARVVMLPPPQGRRGRAAQWMGQVGLVCLAALTVAAPANLLPFGVLLLLSTLLVPDLLWRARPEAGRAASVLDRK